MKKLITGIAIIMAMTFGAQAQDSTEHKGHGYGQHQQDRYKDLNLTDAQKQQVAALNADFKTKMDAIKKDESMTMKEVKDKRKVLLMEHRTAFQNLLTPDQKAKLDELQKNGGEKGKHKRKDAA